MLINHGQKGTRCEKIDFPPLADAQAVQDQARPELPPHRHMNPPEVQIENWNKPSMSQQPQCSWGAQSSPIDL